MLLDMQPKVLKTDEKSQQRDMEEKRALVDTMFKYLDVDQDGRLVSDELEKVGVQLSVVRKKKSHKTDSIHKTQVSQNPEIPNWLEKTLFTPCLKNLHCSYQADVSKHPNFVFSKFIWDSHDKCVWFFFFPVSPLDSPESRFFFFAFYHSKCLKNTRWQLSCCSDLRGHSQSEKRCFR